MLKTPSSTVIGGAFWTPDAVMLGSDQSFDQIMKRLFANNEQGAYLDPNDLSTMFQDAAGTIPVTGAGQPIGLVLDKSNGLVLGSNVATGFTSGFIPTDSVDAVLSNTPTGVTSSNWFPVTPSAFYKIQAPISNRCRVQVKNASGVITFLTAYSSETSADARLVAASEDSVFMRVYFANEGIIGSQVTTFEARKLTGNHAYQTVSASRPILRKNAVTGANYLEFDGSDDFLQTSNVDFTSTDKVSLFTGVRKLSDAARSMLVELSLALATNVFHLEAPVVAGLANYTFVSAGSSASSAVYTNSIVAAPVSNVITAQGKIGDNLNILRVNGSQKSSATASQGTGNYGNYPLFIGRRAGTSLPFNGHVYGLIVLGRLATDTETAAIEKEFAKRMGVTLSV